MRKFFIAIILLSIYSCGSDPRTTSDGSLGDHPNKSINDNIVTLSFNDILAWRDTYGDLLGKPKETAIERYGPPIEEEEKRALKWKASEKTNGRPILLVTSNVGSDASILGVKVFKKDNENFDPIEIIKKANLFYFESGTYIDSTQNYFTAETKDRRNSFQFNISDNDVKFLAAIFSKGKKNQGME